MLCRACDRLEPHNHNKNLYCVKCFTPLDNIEKYDLWCKTCIMDVMNTWRCWTAVSSYRHKTKIMQLSDKLKSIRQWRESHLDKEMMVRRLYPMLQKKLWLWYRVEEFTVTKHLRVESTHYHYQTFNCNLWDILICGESLLKEWQWKENNLNKSIRQVQAIAREWYKKDEEYDSPLRMQVVPLMVKRFILVTNNASFHVSRKANNSG